MNTLLRRTLVPLLIVAVPIAAMIAFILYHKQPRPNESNTPAVPETATFGTENWSVFRGDKALSGHAAGSLPNALQLQWSFQTGDAVRSTPIIAEGIVFVTSMDKHLYAIDLNTGKQIWKFLADDELEASATYHNGALYSGSNGGVFYCVDAQTGKQRWSFETGGKITGSGNVFVACGDGVDVVIFGSYDNNLYCLEANTGNPVFKYPAKSYINGSVALADGAAVFGSCDANIYWVPISDPNSAKAIDAGSYVATNPAVDDNMIYAGSYEGIFLAADIDTQTTLWTFGESQGAFLSAPALNDFAVVVGCRNRNVYCLDRLTGNKRWMFSALDKFDSSPVICGDKVAVGCDDGRLYLLDMETGKAVFSYTLGAPVVSSAAIAQNHLVIGCDNGFVYAFVSKSE